ncbi:MAG TPA: nucleoside deaminase [Aquella sp.]|nr:nucleoside deaminase [Aquella sp.]
MQNLPIYLQEKLKSFAINSVADLMEHDYLQVFAWIRDKYPSSGYKILYDLYCIISNFPLNSLDSTTEKQLRQSYKEILPCYAPLDIKTIKKYLDLAHDQAKLAYESNEIPIGVVVVKNNKVIATGHNLSKTANLSWMHAEIRALANASAYLKSPYLTDCDLYVTIEPCLMCSGAIINSRIKRVIFGATEKKTGAVISQYQVFKNKSVNHQTQTSGPVDTAKYSKLLSQFLKSKR